jgi:elongation factor Tu
MPTDPSFRMTVQDVFFIRDRGTVVTGQIEQGVLKVGDELQIQRPGTARKVIVTGLEMFRKQLTQAGAGENVGILLKNLDKDDLKAGDILTGGDASTGSGSEFSWNL